MPTVNIIHPQSSLLQLSAGGYKTAYKPMNLKSKKFALKKVFSNLASVSQHSEQLLQSERQTFYNPNDFRVF